MSRIRSFLFCNKGKIQISSEGIFDDYRVVGNRATEANYEFSLALLTALSDSWPASWKDCSILDQEARKEKI